MKSLLLLLLVTINFSYSQSVGSMKLYLERQRQHQEEINRKLNEQNKSSSGVSLSGLLYEMKYENYNYLREKAWELDNSVEITSLLPKGSTKRNIEIENRLGIARVMLQSFKDKSFKKDDHEFVYRRLVDLAEMKSTGLGDAKLFVDSLKYAFDPNSKPQDKKQAEKMLKEFFKGSNSKQVAERVNFIGWEKKVPFSTKIAAAFVRGYLSVYNLTHIVQSGSRQTQKIGEPGSLKGRSDKVSAD